eukprot:6000141-Lingulodinium_polyedra.AAC.1
MQTHQGARLWSARGRAWQRRHAHDSAVASGAACTPTVLRAIGTPSFGEPHAPLEVRLRAQERSAVRISSR